MSLSNFSIRVIVLVSLILGSKHSIAELKPVIIKDATLKTHDGEMLRGTTYFFDLYDAKDLRENEKQYREYFDSIFEKHPLNCVRICPWIGNWSYDIVDNPEHQKEYLYAIDTLVEWCRLNDVYAIVNFHIQYNTEVKLDKAKAAWDILAPRYHDQPHVIYELVNEPEPKSSLAVMGELYQHVRKIAPKTHFIVYSHVAATQFSIENLAESSEGIDFKNASVGFHCYDNNLLHAAQWDHAEKLRKAGYPMICTEYISLTNNNHMPISYKHLMHCMMRAEERNLAWISWGPFAQYRNKFKKGWTHEAVRYAPEFDTQLKEFGLDLKTGPNWLANGQYDIQVDWGNGFLTNPSKEAWQTIEVTKDAKPGSRWNLKRVDGNIYRIQSSIGEKVYLQGNFKNEEPWQDLQTADDHADWTSQKFQLLRVKEETYRIKCLWGDLYLTGRNVSDSEEKESNVRMAPLNKEWTSQHWRITKAGNSKEND